MNLQITRTMRGDDVWPRGTCQSAKAALLTVLVCAAALAGCSKGGPSDDEARQAYVASPAGGGNAKAYSEFKVVQCKQADKPGYQCDVAFKFFAFNRTASGRFFKNGDAWVMTDIVRNGE
jgi:hypothetical protein